MITYYRFIVSETIRSFRKNNSSLTASALTYQGLLSFIPFLLLIFLLLGKYIMSSEVVFLNFKNTISFFLPYSQDIILEEASKLYVAEGQWSITGIVACVWFIFPLVDGLKTLFCGVFKEKINRPFLIELASNVLSTFILMFLVVFLVLGEVVYIEIIKPLIKSIKTPFDLMDVTGNVSNLQGIAGNFFDIRDVTGSFFDFIDVVGNFFGLIDVIGNFFITLLGLILFYYLFIPVRVTLRHIAAGAALTTVAWLVLRPSFAFLLHINPHMGFIFGSLKAVFIVFSWVYMYFYFLILGVEFTASFSKIRLIAVESLLSNRTAKPGAKALARFTLNLQNGDVIFDKDAQADCFYFVMSGLVSLCEDGYPPILKTTGDTFGIEEMLLNSIRAKTAVSCSDDVVIFPVHSDDLKALEKINPQIPLTILKNHLTLTKR